MSTVRKPAIDTCNACGKLFPRVSMRLCTACSLAEHHRFELVRDYLDESGSVSLAMITEATGVSLADVRKFLEGGRLITVDGGAPGVCTCGGAGDRCDACRKKMASTFKGVHEEMSREDNVRRLDPHGSGDAPSHQRRRRTGG